MKVNRENYGRFIIDYYDGQLSSEEQRELMLFFEQNPELKSGFEDFQEIKILPVDSVEFPDKQALKKPVIKDYADITGDNFSGYFVLYQDDELTNKERQSVEIFLQQNPHLQEELRQFGLSKVAPDESVVFENKERLKKHRIIPLMRIAVMAVAAALILFFGIRFFLTPPRQKTESRQLAVESIPLKTMGIAVAEIPPRLIRKNIPGAVHKTKTIAKSVPMMLQKPVEMMASADIYMPLKRKKDYAPLLFPNIKAQEEIIALSSPVVVEQPKRSGFLNQTIGKPFSRLAAVFALQKRKRKLTGTHDKGFVRVLQRGVDAMNVLTDNDMVMVKTYDANGNLIDYQLLSDNFSIHKPVKEGQNR